MEEPLDEDNQSHDELIVGKKPGKSGLKVTYVTFDYSDILSLQDETHGVWVYESNMFLKIKEPTEDRNDFIPRVTQIHPLLKPVNTIDTSNLVDNAGIDESPSGEFKPMNRLPRMDKFTSAVFTNTIHKYINPNGQNYQKENNGIVLVNEYSDAVDPRTDSLNIRYYGLDEGDEDDKPHIDVCYKVVTVPRCEEGTIEVIMHVKDAVMVDKETPDENYKGENLKVGSPDGTTNSEKRFLLDFKEFDKVLYSVESVKKAWIHLTFRDFVEQGGRDFAINNTIEVTKVNLPDGVDSWDEDTATWANTQSTTKGDNFKFSTVNAPEEQPGTTPIVVTIVEIDAQTYLAEEFKGFLFKSVDEPNRPHSIPEFFGKDETVYPKPELHVCVPKSTTPTPTPTQTHTPTFTSSSSSSTTTAPPPIENCTIPNGGGRIVVNLEKYITIQEEPTTGENERFIEIGKKKGAGEKISLVYFDLVQAVSDAFDEMGKKSKEITVTDSKINFRLTPDDNDAPWVPGRPVLYPLKKMINENSTWEEPWIGGSDGPLPGVDYYKSIHAAFTKLKQKPGEQWLQAVGTTIARYIFTQLNDVRMDNNGFLMRYETTTGDDASHFVFFNSPNSEDEEFYPWMDICYLPVERPEPCEDGELVYYDINADTYIARDTVVHGAEEYLFVGNSGWDGNARTLVDFDISQFNTDLTELYDDKSSVFLQMWYEGPVMGKPYNDPRQMERQLAAHKVKKGWNEDVATNKVASMSGDQKNRWGEDMMEELKDYDPDVIDSDTISEGEAGHFVYLNLTSVFLEWMKDKSSDHGVMIKDSLHETVPGYFLKFASINNKDPTLRPKLQVCQKKPICEPVDLEPQLIYNKGCVSKEEVVLNYCVAKNGACSEDDGDSMDYGYAVGVSALWDDNHVLRTFCKCCTDAEDTTMQVDMDCTDNEKEADYSETVHIITRCECQRCETLTQLRKKRSAPSKTRLLLRSALKSMLRK